MRSVEKGRRAIATIKEWRERVARMELYQPDLEAGQRASGAQSFIAFPFRGLDRMKSHRNYLQKVLAQAWCKWSRFEIGKGDQRGTRILTVTPNLRERLGKHRITMRSSRLFGNRHRGQMADLTKRSGT